MLRQFNVGKAAMFASYIGALLFAASPETAWADPSLSPSDQQQTSGSANPTTPVATIAQTTGGQADRDPAKFKRFDDLREPMLTSRFPGIMDTITGDAGGWRSWLADRDVGVELRLITTGVFPLRGSGGPRDPQLYNGQRPTLQTHALNGYVIAGLSELGLPNTKIIVAGGYNITSFEPNGPSTATFKELSIYQSFADKAVEIKVGFVQNYLEYAGLFAGGNVTLSNGLSTLIPIQVGLSAEPTTAPTVNIAFNGKHGLYGKLGVQRSVNPSGSDVDVMHHGIGLTFSQHGARALYIGEIGIKRDAAPGQRSLWLRAGYLYNSSQYARFLGGTDHNYAAYALADYQLTRPDDALFFRGLYVGMSAETAPKSVNVYAKSAELRAYYVGPFNSRPFDAINATITWNRYSSGFHAANLPAGLDTERYQLAGAISYAFHAYHGVTLSPAIQYSIHPTPLPGYRDGVLGSVAAYLAF